MKLEILTAPALHVEHNARLRPGKKSVHFLGGHRVQTTGKSTIVKDVLDVWLEQPLDAKWMAAFRLVRGGTNRFRVGEVRIFPVEVGSPAGEWSGSWRGVEAEAPRRGLTTQILKRARPHLWLREAEKNLPTFRRLFHEQFPGAMTDPVPRSRDTRGRPRVPDETLARVAEQYVRACATSHRPVEVVAQQCGKSVVRVRGWIHKARTRGLLSRREQGQTGGQLTARATSILQQQKRGSKKRGK